MKNLHRTNAFTVRLTDDSKAKLETSRGDMRLRSMAAVLDNLLQCTPAAIEWMRGKVAEYDAQQAIDETKVR